MENFVVRLAMFFSQLIAVIALTAFYLNFFGVTISQKTVAIEIGAILLFFELFALVRLFLKNRQ